MPLPVLEFLSLRTFTSVWYWIAVAVVWALVSHRPLGVPYDMVWRARQDSAARARLDTVARALAGHVASSMTAGGTVVVALVSAVLSALLLLALFYEIEFAQGLLLIALPLAFVGVLNLRAARSIDAGADPIRHLRRLRASTHAVAVVALFVTALWGMYVNFAAMTF